MLIDEATANVDPRTDQLIQKTIRRKFSNRTVITIAHRLETIAGEQDKSKPKPVFLDSDRILVMNKGQLVENDKPKILVKNTESAFYKMIAESKNVQGILEMMS